MQSTLTRLFALKPLVRVSTLVLMAAIGGSAQNASDSSSKITRLDGSTITQKQGDETVTHLIEAAHVTGAGIAVFREGRIAFEKAYGLRDTEKGLALTPDSVMTSASLSKAAFASVVMRLVQEGTLDLDKPVYQYLPIPLPDYPQYDDLRGDDRYKKISLRMLLSHTSGFANWRAFEEDRKLKIHFDPGTRYAYSGEGIQLAQLVVETVTSQSLTTLMEKKLFAPLQMSRTSMIWQAAFENDFANGYDEYGRSLGPQKRTKPGAAGSMQTTLHDYALFLSAIIQEKLLDAKTTAAMLHPQVNIRSAHQFPSLATETTAANDSIHLSYGLGWGLYSTPNGRAFFKEGHDEGWRHLALCFDQNGTGILIMTNSSNGEAIFKPLLEALLGSTYFPFNWEGYTPYTEAPPPPKLKEHKRVVLTSAQLKQFEGKYALPPQVVLTVTEENGHLFIQENDEPRQELIPEGQQDFYSASSSDECSFVPTDGTPYKAMILHVDGKDIRLERLH